MNYEAGFCVFAFIVFCAVLVYALYRRALAVDFDNAARAWAAESDDDVLLSRDDVLELAKPAVHVSKVSDSEWKEMIRKEFYPEYTDLINRGNSSSTDKPLPKGWQPWEGGDCPVPDDTQVVVMFADGVICHDSAGNCGWTHHSANVTNYCHILAWRVAD